MQEFNFHTHTQRCNHADYVEDEVFVKALIKAGFKRMAFTDHAPFKYFDILNPKYDVLFHMRTTDKKEYYGSIENLKEKYKEQITIYSGFEVEYIPQFIEEIKDMFNETDILVLGQHITGIENGEGIFIHDRHDPDDVKRYADLIEEGLSTGLFKILAHPDLFKFDFNPLKASEIKASEKILKAAEKYSIPIEINLAQVSKGIITEKESPFCYPCREFWEMALDYDVKVLWGIDAHRLAQIELHNQILECAIERIGKDVISKLHFIDSLPFEIRSDK